MQRITLRNIHHIDIPFEVEILEPHPYFHVDPCLGTIPAGKSVHVKVTYKPITLGSSAMALRLSVKLPGVVPKDMVVSARAVSGLLEKEELVHAQQRIQQCLGETTLQTNNTLKTNGSTYRFDVTRLNTATGAITDGDLRTFQSSNARAITAPNNNTTGSTLDGFALGSVALGLDLGLGMTNSGASTASTNRRPLRDRSDPAAALLAVTFNGAANTYEALNKTIAVMEKPRRRLRPGDEIPPMTDTVDNILLGSKVMDMRTGKIVPKSRITPRPRGLGAGNVFDAGAEWMSNQFHKKYLHRLSQQNSKKQMEASRMEEEAANVAAATR